MTNNPTIDGVSLLPCPFCGKEPRYVPADYVDNHGQPWPFAECNPCNVGAPVEFWNKRIGFDYSAHALQSTIAQLQARVAELESGRGEPVTMDGKTTVREYVADSVPEDQIGDDWTKGYEECKRRIHRMFQQPVNANARFTAPPAPAAVVLPERMEPPSDYAYRKGWNACLDATAALNEVKA